MSKSIGPIQINLRNCQTAKDVEQAYLDLGLSKNFCPVPFTSVVFEADGAVCLCRQKGNYFEIGNLKNNSIDQIWNSEKIVSIRKEFLSGEISTCKNEILADKCNLNPSRFSLMKDIFLNSVQNTLPIKISPNFNGLCNLKCPMCRVWQQENGFYDKINFWNKLEKEIIPYLEEIDSFSGEPFIQKDTYRLIQMTSKIKPDILWSFTTNGQWRFSSYIEDHLNKIQLKMITFSVDSLNASTLVEIRPNTKLNLLLDSIEEIVSYNEKMSLINRQFKIGVNLTVQKKNWLDSIEVIRWARKNNFLLNARLLTEPYELSILSESSAEKLKRILDLISIMQPEDKPYIASLIKPILITLSFTERKNVLNSWLNY